MKKFLTISILIIVLVGCVCAMFACAPEDKGTPSSNYIISFNTLGGNAIKSITLKSGSTLTLPDDPVKDGYVFTGWFLDNECKREVNIALFRVVSNTTIFAGWESVDTYRHFINIDPEIEDGYLKVITPEDGRASYGTLVKVSVNPLDGYELVEGTLKANDIELVHESAQIYSFTMPKSAVNLTCEFDLAALPVSILTSYENGLVVLSKESARPGEQVSVQAIPDYGYRLKELYILNNNLNGVVGDVKISILQSSSFYMGTKEVFVGAQFEKIDYGIAYDINVVSSQGGRVILNSTSSPAGVFVDLAFESNDGYRLDTFLVTGESWTSIVNASQEGFIMPSEDVNITAYFVPITNSDANYELTINENENGIVSIIDKKEGYKKGEKVYLSVTPNDGYVLQNLFVNGVNLIGNEFIMPGEDATITAEFVKKGYGIEADVNNCEISLSKEYAYAGDVVYFEIFEHEGYHLNPGSVALNGTIITENFFIMPENDVILSASAYSSNITHAISVNVLPNANSAVNGTITPSVTEAKLYQEVHLIVNEDNGYRIKANSIKATYAYMGEEREIYVVDNSFVMPDAPVTITGSFERVYNVNTTEEKNVSIFPSAEEIAVGDVVLFDVVTHGNVIANSVECTLRFGEYEERFTPSTAFRLTQGILDQAGNNPSLSLIVTSYSETNANRAYNISVKPAQGGAVSVIGSDRGQYGEIIRLSIREYDGFELESIYLSTNNGDSYSITDTFIMPDSTVTITPKFKVREDEHFSLGTRFNKNVERFNRAGLKLDYSRNKYQLKERYPALANHKFLNYLVDAVKVEAEVGHDFYILEVNDVSRVTPIASFIHQTLANEMGISKSDINVYINYNYLVFSIGGDPKEDFYLYKNGITVLNDFIIYERDDCSYGIYAYIGDSEYVSIPERYGNKSISYLGPKAFKNPQSIKGINLSCVKELGDFALENTSITRIDLKDVSKLGKGVFKNCKYLRVFTASTLNDSLIVDNSVLYLKSKGNNYDTLYAYPMAKTADNDAYAIASQTVNIAPYAFYGSFLKVVSYGSSLKTIGDYAFQNSSVESIKYSSQNAIPGVVDFLNSSISVLGDGAFAGCGALQTFHLNSVTQIGDGAIVWDGVNTLQIILSGDVRVGVVKIIAEPIIIPSNYTGIFIISIPNDEILRELYANSNWSKYNEFFSN